MLEALAVRVTVLKCIQEVGKTTTLNLRKTINFDSNDLFSSALDQMEKLKYIKKDKKGKGVNSNLWSITRKGESLLIEHRTEVVSYAVLANNFQDYMARKKSQPKGNYTQRPTLSNSKEANLAMQGISELLQKDQRNTQLLRNIYRQIGDALGMDAEVEVEQKD